jgi:hypothetical protein
MKKNIGKIDKIVRMVAALILLALYFSDSLQGSIGGFMVVLAIILIATVIVSFCPIYALVGLNTCTRKTS